MLLFILYVDAIVVDEIKYFLTYLIVSTLWVFQVTIHCRSSEPVPEADPAFPSSLLPQIVSHASVVDDGPDECLVDDQQDAFGLSPSRSTYCAHEVQPDFASVDVVVDACCPCEALIEDDTEELNRLLELDRNDIDLREDCICRDVLASREEMATVLLIEIIIIIMLDYLYCEYRYNRYMA